MAYTRTGLTPQTIFKSSIAEKEMSTPSIDNLLSPGDCMLTFVDHQAELAFAVPSMDRQTLVANSVARPAGVNSWEQGYGRNAG